MERVDHLVDNSPEDTVFVTFIGSNILFCDSTDEMLGKYRSFLRIEESSYM